MGLLPLPMKRVFLFDTFLSFPGFLSFFPRLSFFLSQAFFLSFSGFLSFFLVRSFVYSFVCLFVRSFVNSLIRSFGWSVGRSAVRLHSNFRIVLFLTARSMTRTTLKRDVFNGTINDTNHIEARRF
jgi:hypothetical protein